MVVEEKNVFGELTEEELNDFELTNEIRLPNDYRTFLLSNNGGTPLKNHIHISQKIITYLFGMHNGDYYASLYKQIEVYKNRLPFSTFPIGSDPFGNLYIMSVHPENYGQIYFWQHEGEAEIQNGNYVGNVSFVAYSFDELSRQTI